MPDRLTRLAYGSGAASLGAELPLVGLLLLFYNQLVGLPAAAVSVVLSASAVLGTIWDPLVGEISDSTRSRWGRRHPYLYGVAGPFALAFALLWRPPAGWSQPVLLAWLAIFAILARLLASLADIPSAALLPELARGYDERTKLVGYRHFFGAIGAIASTALGFGIFLKSTPEQPFGQLNRAGYAPFGTIIACFILVTIVISALGTHGYIPRLYSPPPASHGVWERVRGIVDSLRSRDFAVIAAAGLLHGINLGVHSGLGVYFGTYFWKLPSNKLGWLVLAALPANIVAALAGPVLARRWGKKEACIGLFFAGILLGNLPLAAALLGWMPEPGSTTLLAILAGDGFLVTVIGTGGFILVTSMVADLVEETELRTGRRSEGLLLAAETFLRKLSAGVTVVVPGLLLVLVGFPPHADPKALDPLVMRHLALISLPLRVVLGIAATSVLLFYRIDRRAHEANLTRLETAGAPAFDASPRLEASTVEEPDGRLDTGIFGYQRAENEQENPTEAGGHELLSRGRPATLQIVR
jgi:glycoside/pentoside/hexuronide:cation symporter, GPH family